MEQHYLTISSANFVFMLIIGVLLVWVMKLNNEINRYEHKISDLEFKIECEKVRKNLKKLK